MKQFRITTANITQSEDHDCILSSDDPIHQLKAVGQLGGLGGEAALSAYRSLTLPVIQGSNKGQVARENSIKPGTDEWFKHWFGDAK